MKEILTEEQMKDFDYSNLTPLFDIIPEIEKTKDFLNFRKLYLQNYV